MEYKPKRSPMDRRSQCDRRGLSPQAQECLRCCTLAGATFVGIQPGYQLPDVCLFRSPLGLPLSVPVKDVTPLRILLEIAHSQQSTLNRADRKVAHNSRAGAESPRSRSLTAMRKLITTIMALMLMAAPFASANSGTSNAANVSLSLTIPTSFTVSATPASITFDQNGNASGPITVTTQWNLVSAIGDYIEVDAYFASTDALLGATSPNDKIPSSAVFASMNAGAAAPCNGSGNAATGVGAATAGANCGSVFRIQSLAANQGSHTDNVTLSIPSASTPGAIIPDTYAGTLTFSGQYN
jgi:hypothetical protein